MAVFTDCLGMSSETSSITFENSTGNIGFDVRIQEKGEDTVFRRLGIGKDWDIIFRGKLTGINTSDKFVSTGSIPPRIRHETYETGEQNSFVYIEFQSDKIFGRVIRHEAPIIVPKRNGFIVKPVLEKILDGSGAEFRSVSYQMEDGRKGVDLVRMSDKKTIAVNGDFTKGDYKVKFANGQFVYQSNGVVVDLSQFSTDLAAKIADPIKATAAPVSKEKSTAAANIEKSVPEAELIKTSDEVPQKPYTKSGIQVKNGEGKMIDAWAELAHFAIDLSDIKPTGIDPDGETMKLINDIERNLVKKEIGSVKILGPPGTGKTHLVKKFIEHVNSGKGSVDLKNVIYLMMDPAAFTSGTQNIGSTETKVNAMKELSKKFNIVWILDEAHTIKGTGTHRSNPNDSWQLLKPGLTEGYIRIIAMSTQEEWDHAYAGDKATNDRFIRIPVEEKRGKDLEIAMRSFLSKYSFPEITQSLLSLIIRYSDDFNAEGNQPRKGTKLIEEIYAEQKRLTGGYHEVTIAEVRQAAQRLYRLHEDHFDKRKMWDRIDRLPKVLTKSVVGQETAKVGLVDSLKIAISGMSDKSKPKGRKILAGPKGLGKTTIIDALGEGLGIKPDVVNMQDYTQSGDVDSIKQRLVDILSTNANAIILFDEFEKANDAIQKSLLDILAKGKFLFQTKGSDGRPITLDFSLRNSFVYIATNAGDKYIESLRSKEDYDPVEMEKAMRAAGLNDLIIDRMDGIVPFFFLNKQQYRRVVLTEIRKIVNQFKESHPDNELKITNIWGFINQFVDETFHEKMSNREVLRRLTSDLRLSIAEATRRIDEFQPVELNLTGVRKISKYISKQCVKFYSKSAN